MRLITFLFFFSINYYSFGQSGTIDSLKEEVRAIRNEMSDKQEQLDYQKDQINSQAGMLDTSFDGVSAQIGAASNYLTIFTIIISIVTIGLGVYVSIIERKIRSITQDNETLLQKNIQIKKEIESLSQKITSDSRGLYNIIQKEESRHIIERLVKVPNDIVNIGTMLLARELGPELFEKTKEAFSQAEPHRLHIYDTVFFQHFLGQAILDPILKPRMLSSISKLISNSFKNDILKSTTDYFNSIYKEGIFNCKLELNTFVNAISKSKYANYQEIYIAIFNQMQTREIKFELYSNIEKTEDSKLFRKEYGKYLLDFKGENPNPEESGIINEIENIIIP